jgi:hypothetical protein
MGPIVVACLFLWGFSVWGQQEDGIPLEVQEQFEKAENLLELGKEKMFDLSLAEAKEAFSQARGLIRQQIEWLDDSALLVEVLMNYAEALICSQEVEQAKIIYREVLVLSPGYVPDPNQFPPKFCKLFEEVRGQVAEETKGKPAIASETVEQPIVVEKAKVEKIEEKIIDPEYLGAKTPFVRPTPQPTTQKWWQSWWFWSSAGALVVAGLVTSIAVAASDRDTVYQPNTIGIVLQRAN